MNAARLSQLTWTLDDRRAWMAAYEAARRIDRERRRTIRVTDTVGNVSVVRLPFADAAQVGRVRDILQSDARLECVAYQVGRHSVHVDRMGVDHA